MIEKLQRKIFGVLWGILMLVLLGFLIAVNFSSSGASRRSAVQNAQSLASLFLQPQHGGLTDTAGEAFTAVPQNPEPSVSQSAENSASTQTSSQAAPSAGESLPPSESVEPDSEDSDPALLPPQNGPEPDGFEQDPRRMKVQTSAFWLVWLDENGTVTQTVSGNTEQEITQEQILQAKALAAAATSTAEQNAQGLQKNMAYAVRTAQQGMVVVLVDYSAQHTQQVQTFFVSVALGLALAALLAWLCLVLSRWIVKPVQQTFDKQKQFISDASHELKTPLTVIGANVEMLKETVGENKYLGYIATQTQSMTGLVNDLLALARVENGVGSRQPQPVDFGRTVESAVLPFESVAFEENISLETAVPLGLWVLGSAEQLHRLTAILVDNALCHTAAGKKVTVSLEIEKEKCLLRVANEGEPIPPQEQHRIFERFYRTDVARNRGENHYGLGLAIASSIAAQHKGRIGVECADGVTTFWVRLPRLSHG